MLKNRKWDLFGKMCQSYCLQVFLVYPAYMLHQHLITNHLCVCVCVTTSFSCVPQLHMFSILDSCFVRLYRVAWKKKKKKLCFVSSLSYSTRFGDTSPLAHPLYLTHNCYIFHFKSSLAVSLCIFLVLVINWPNIYANTQQRTFVEKV